MLRRLAAGSVACALVLLLVGPSVPRIAHAASGRCTGWTSEYLPPPTIRVYRTFGPARGRVQVVPFQQYVTTVMAAEFGAAAPAEALRAGAVAVKDYGWYYTMVWRGRSAPNHAGCYDVVDSSVDQVYWPEHDRPAATQTQAVLDTWRVSVRKQGGFLLTGYRPGTPRTACGADADGWHLYQASAYRCAAEGMLFEEILRTYYGPAFQLVVPGVHDPSGDGLGEIGVVMPGAGAAAPAGPDATPSPGASASMTPAASTAPSPAAGPSAAPSPSDAPSPSVAPSPDPSRSATPASQLAQGTPMTGSFWTTLWADAPEEPWQPTTIPAGTTPTPVVTLGWSLADLTRDGRADVVRLERMGTAGYRVTVSLASGGGHFQPAATWWSSTENGPDVSPTATVRLLTGDFTGDGVEDVALLVGEAGTPPAVGPGGLVVPAVLPEARLYMLRSTLDGLAPARTWWSGPLDVSRVTAFGADVTGDGRADLLIGGPLYPADLAAPSDPAAPQPALGADGTELPDGLRFAVAPSGREGGLGPASPWLDMPDITPDQAQIVTGDVNGDGFSDVIVFRPTGTSGSQFVGLLSTGSGFTRSNLWTASAGFRWSASKLASSDVNGDGLGDVVVLYDAGSAGTRLFQFLSNGRALRAGPRVLVPTLNWADALPV